MKIFIDDGERREIPEPRDRGLILMEITERGRKGFLADRENAQP